MNILILHAIGGKAGDHWEQWLHDQLVRAGHTVVMPTLTNSNHPDRSEWQKEVEAAIEGLDLAQLIIVGHSLGVPTALDVIEQLPHPIKGLIAVAGFAVAYGAALNDYFMKERSIDFEKVRQNIGKSFVFYGDDDPYVTQEALHGLAIELNVEPKIIAKGKHLNTEAGYTEFPELLEAVRSLESV